MSDYERTRLWSNALSAGGDALDRAAKERLRTAYRQFWSNAVTLSRQIQRDLPNLTLHDESHFEALWGRADQIAGPSYALTPLEVFVLGGAILLHDAANSVAAFPGGLREIHGTPEWKDAAAEWLERRGEGSAAGELPEEAQGPVLFEALRALHAPRAETLASMQVRTDDATYRLFPDDQLREHLGGLIGSIAASHHWDVSALPARLRGPRGALTGMPANWTIRPVMLACLLRCADATQLDQRRAPDFLYGLLQLRGVSERHWRAQNRLATPFVDPNDSHALLFTSTMPFREQDADAWWIAFDAIQVANRELQAADSLLRDLKLPPFAVNRIRGADSPARLAEHVSVQGWRPVSAEVKVGRVDKIVDMFGGDKLYGHDLSVPLRELIQNAADAVRLRRELEPSGSHDEGQVTVRLSRVTEEEASDFRLSVEDDGIGMSEAVLTGPLLDFGGSYVSSALVKSERPGLLSKGRRRIGKYGIGFFSCFMLAKEVLVTSRPFDQGLDCCRTLRFRDGMVTRPLLLEHRPTDFGARLTTRVSLLLTPDRKAEMLTLRTGISSSGTSISLAQLVGILCPMLDVDVYLEDEAGRRLIHTRRWMEEDRLAWLKRILVPEVRGHRDLLAQLEAAAPHLTFIDPNDPSAGLASISGSPGGGVMTIGTLKASPRFTAFKDEYIGTIDHEPDGPRRGEGVPKAAGRLPVWATDQARRVAAAGVGLPWSHYAAQRVARFGGDATSIASMMVNREWANLDEILRRMAGGEELYAPAKNDRANGGQIVITVVRLQHYGFVDNYRKEELEFLVPTLESPSDSSNELLYRVPTEVDPAEVSFCSLLTRYARERGYRIDGEFVQHMDFASYVGKPSEREGLSTGSLLGGPGLRLSCVRVPEA